MDEVERLEKGDVGANRLAAQLSVGRQIADDQLLTGPHASDAKTLVLRVTIFGFDGAAEVGPIDAQVGPNGSSALGSTSVNARHCVVEILSGGRKNARVSLSARDSSGDVQAVVSE